MAALSTKMAASAQLTCVETVCPAAGETPRRGCCGAQCPRPHCIIITWGWEPPHLCSVLMGIIQNKVNTFVIFKCMCIYSIKRVAIVFWFLKVCTEVLFCSKLTQFSTKKSFVEAQLLYRLSLSDSLTTERLA